MTKAEAGFLARKGYKITHATFSPNEWFTIIDTMIHLEDGVACDPYEFWNYRTAPVWKDGYSIFEEPK